MDTAETHDLFRPDPGVLRCVEERLKAKITTGAYSTVFLVDLALHLELGTDNIFAILDEIGALEDAPGARPSRTKAEARFEHPPLRGL